MRATEPVDRLSLPCPAHPFRNVRRMLKTALLAIFLPCCAASAKAVSPPPAKVAPPAPMPKTTDAATDAPAKAPATPAAPPPIIVHQADLHGQLESKHGSTLTIRALLMMTKTQPEVGNKGVLFYAPESAQGEGDWVNLGDVEVKKALDANGKLQVKIVGDKNTAKKPSSLAKNARLRLRWEF